MSTTSSLASSTTMSALAMPSSTGFNNNTVSVTNGVWPGLTCPDTHNFKSIPDLSYSFGSGAAVISVVPANEQTWPVIVGCFGKGANITVGDGGVGCFAEAVVDIAHPGVAYRCLKKAAPWREIGCEGDVGYACATSSVPSALIASKLAQASTMSTATSTSISSAAVTTSTATTSTTASTSADTSTATSSTTSSSAAATTSAKSSAQMIRPRSIGKIELAVASMLALSLVFGIAL